MGYEIWGRSSQEVLKDYNKQRRWGVNEVTGIFTIKTPNMIRRG